MIWGKTDKQKEASKLKIGDEEVKFTYIPHRIQNGRWVWWEYVRCIYISNRSFYWSWREVVKRPKKSPRRGFYTGVEQKLT